MGRGDFFFFFPVPPAVTMDTRQRILAAAAGMAYMGGPNTVTYFGALLFHDTPGPAQKGVFV